MSENTAGLPPRIDGDGSNPVPACERTPESAQGQSGAKFPTLADVIAKHADYVSNLARHCTCGEWHDHSLNAPFSRASFGAHVQDEWRKACTIETVEQLHALPAGTVIRTSFTNIREKLLVGWIPIGGARPLPPDRLHRMLPALVLYVPGDPA